MTPENDDKQPTPLSQAEFQELLHEKMRQAVRVTLISILEEEVKSFVNAPRYQRTVARRDRRNGYYTRDLGTSIGVIEDLPVPRTRQGFRTQVFARYQRRQAELDQAIGDMFILGVSTQRVGEVVETLSGSKPSASTVSRVFHTLEEEFQAWRQRPLATEYRYAFADGTYFTVIYDGEGCKTPILAVVGIQVTGERELLAFTVGDRENQHAWEDLLAHLKERGVQRVGLWISDGQQAMINALELQFPDAARQRCIKHKLDNVLGYIPQQQQEVIAPELKALFYQDHREQAEQAYAAFCAKYAPIYPTAVACLQRDHEACFRFYAFPREHWRTIRTNNVIERLFNEVKRRSHKMAAAFRNEQSCLLLFYAVVRTLRFHRLPPPSK
jgi:transposase-like protein